jgi:hypothetical protein
MFFSQLIACLENIENIAVFDEKRDKVYGGDVGDMSLNTFRTLCDCKVVKIETFGSGENALIRISLKGTK